MFIFAALTLSSARAEVTLSQCLSAAEENYPLIKKYDLLTATESVDLSDINKGWLPRLGLYAQGTAQNVVPSFPSTLSDVMQKMGGEVKGLGKLQYKVGLDVSQTLWDGGASKSQRDIARRQTEVNRARLDVEIYGIRQRVESLYFGILLMQSQIERTEAAIGVYQANLSRLQSMLANGVAMQSDVDMLEAQLLSTRQQLTAARTAEKEYRNMLSLFTALPIENETLAIPSDQLPTETTPLRPELSLLDAQAALNGSRREAVKVSLMPKIGLFAQSYYGYPGIDYFKAMMSRDPSFNIIGGVKVSWNIDSFYTKKNSQRKLDIADAQLQAERETFLFNTKMQTTQQREEIEGLRQVMADDNRIVALRTNVRNAAESQLRNGVIDATALTTKINDETQAQLTSAYHKIQYIQAIHNLRNTLNR